jgi:hypothetical protein
LPVVGWMIVAKGLPLLFALILLLPIYSAQQLPLATLRQDASLPLGYGILLTDKTRISRPPRVCKLSLTVAARERRRYRGENDVQRSFRPRGDERPVRPRRRAGFFRLGIRYSTGASVPADMVSAHKWFNIAAMRGNAEGARLRREIAGEMLEAEIATARRAARDSITRLFMRLLSCGC